MNPHTASPGGSPIIPLRLQKPDGTPYVRPPEIEAALVNLSTMPGDALVERARFNDPQHAGYVPSECVLYFMRHPPGNDSALQLALFEILRQRVLAAVPVIPRRLPASGRPGENATEIDVRDAVQHKFLVLLCQDRNAYEARLDYYECKFNDSIACLRATARRDVHREANRFVPLESESAPGEPSPEAEKALLRLRGPAAPDGGDFLYRSKLLRAISSLPPKERQVIELIIQGFQIESIDENEQSIAKMVGCVPQTVRNRRDSAYLKLRTVLGDAEGNT